jgi:hypothetical protein
VTHGTQLTVSNRLTIELIIISTLWAFLRYTCFDRAVAATGAGEELEVVCAREAVIAGGADFTALLDCPRSLDQAIVAHLALGLNASATVASLGAAIMSTNVSS